MKQIDYIVFHYNIIVRLDVHRAYPRVRTHTQQTIKSGIWLPVMSGSYKLQYINESLEE